MKLVYYKCLTNHENKLLIDFFVKKLYFLYTLLSLNLVQADSNQFHIDLLREDSGTSFEVF